MAAKALALVGPTASGKSALAMRVAQRLGGELISMDSRQVYRGLDVGTAKPSLVDRARVPHHGLDLVDPAEPYSAGRFARDARRWITEIRGRGNVPILVGGTGFFLRALTAPIFEEPDLSPERRRKLREWLAHRSVEELRDWVQLLEPARSVVAKARDRQRMTRILELALLTGKPLSWWHANALSQREPVRVAVIMLAASRAVIYRRIDQRAVQMLADGMEEEVRRLLEGGYDEHGPGLSAVGYREVIAYVRGEVERTEALALMQRATRRYARRQMTWFRHQLPPEAIWLDAAASTEELMARCVAIWERWGGG